MKHVAVSFVGYFYLFLINILVWENKDVSLHLSSI